jgi:hypothetical protein
MNPAKTPDSRRSTPMVSSRSPLEIRRVSAKEAGRFDALMGEYHYLGESRPVGDSLRMAAWREGEWVGLLMWGSAAYRLKGRDRHIGWTPVLRAQRQKLIVQNRRFLLLGERGEHPNLASQVLGAAVRELPSLWLESFGYRPLLAETFTDIEAYAGTCYKAAGWLPLGLTQGFARHRADFYVPNDRPKKLWIRELCAGAVALLRAPELPNECLKGAQSDAEGVLPLSMPQLESLHDALCRMKDPRATNRGFHIGSVLSIVAMALFSGHRSIAAIARFGERLHRNHRVALGLPRFSPGGSYRKVPKYKVYYNLLAKLDVHAFAKLLSTWLAQHRGTLPVALALDGKFIADIVGLVCLAEHDTGVPHAMRKASQKEGEGEDCELKAAQALIEQQPDLSHAMVTADALHCQAQTARQIVERGGEFLIQAKGNQKAIHQKAIARTERLTPFLPRRRKPMPESTRAPLPCALSTPLP